MNEYVSAQAVPVPASLQTRPVTREVLISFVHEVQRTHPRLDVVEWSQFAVEIYNRIGATPGTGASASAFSSNMPFRSDCIGYMRRVSSAIAAAAAFPVQQEQHSVRGFPLLNTPETDSSAGLWPKVKKDPKHKLQEWRDTRMAQVEAGQWGSAAYVGINAAEYERFSDRPVIEEHDRNNFGMDTARSGIEKVPEKAKPAGLSVQPNYVE